MNREQILGLPSMPAASPSYPHGPYRFIDREYMIIIYESDPDAIRAAVPDLGRDERLVTSRDGYLFQVITKGQGTMPAYAHQVPTADRWAIVHWIRALQTRFQ